ncbi:hypothetical protein [Burkholderia ubonensis]|uniref:hypothetical protein n=1 Tax=Burkholderia ubonensis TaxID=101571 RepID=UPI000B192316|nr:hypothetical protein [Burkholderia ubonensis]
MSRRNRRMALLSVPASAAMIALSGCGGGDDPVTTGAAATANSVSKDAAVPSSTTVRMTMVESQVANAFFTQLSGCVETSVGVAAVLGDTSSIVDVGPPTRSFSNDMIVFVSMFDWCQNATVLSAFGKAPPASFDMAEDLRGARLTGIVTAKDSIHSTPLDIRVDVTWTGIGDKSDVHSADHASTFPSGFINTHFNGWVRSATVSGTVTDGTTNYTPAVAQFGAMTDIHTGEIDILLASSAINPKPTP